MQGLFKSVNAGVFEKIPKIYSKELSDIINLCLRVNASERPSAE